MESNHYIIVAIINDAEKYYFCGYDKKYHNNPILLKKEEIYLPKYVHDESSYLRDAVRRINSNPKIYADKLKADRALQYLQRTRHFIPGYLQLEIKK